MARPKTKSALVDGMTELVDSLRSIESKLNMLIKNKNLFGPKRGPGRPIGSIKSVPGRVTDGIKRGPGRPPGTTKKPTAKKVSKSGRRGRGRPPGSKNKK
jgi:hypothetical protein